MLRKLLAGLLVLAIPTTVSAVPPDTEKVRERVTRAGAGQYVAIQKTDGTESAGKILDLAREDFRLLQLDGSGPTSIPYGTVVKVKVVKVRAYKTDGQPQPLHVRQAVDGLGVGAHVKAVVPNAEYHGHIQSIGEEAFVVLPDHTSTPVTLPYREVREVRRNDSTALVIVALAVGGIIGYLLATRD